MKFNNYSNKFNKFFQFLNNQKHFIVFGLVAIFIMFFDDYSCYEQASVQSSINRCEHEINYYTNKIKSDSIKLYELQTNDDNLEKFARQEYYFKADNEDVFVIREKE